MIYSRALVKIVCENLHGNKRPLVSIERIKSHRLITHKVVAVHRVVQSLWSQRHCEHDATLLPNLTRVFNLSVHVQLYLLIGEVNLIARQYPPWRCANGDDLEVVACRAWGRSVWWRRLVGSGKEWSKIYWKLAHSFDGQLMSPKSVPAPPQPAQGSSTKSAQSPPPSHRSS